MSDNVFEWKMKKGSEFGYLVVNENSGKWTMGWSNENPQIIQDIWYQGEDKDSGYSTFRDGIAQKLKEGFKAI
ncbi:hypothetical protein [Paenibacillus sp. FSL L8-0709]|uniref:hypothetical protein n=1 Tax=Paenibacillus sp. FSL L8-0709 TaxID=2975312 RepID=UPI0030F91010